MSLCHRCTAPSLKKNCKERSADKTICQETAEVEHIKCVLRFLLWRECSYCALTSFFETVQNLSLNYDQQENAKTNTVLFRKELRNEKSVQICFGGIYRLICIITFYIIKFAAVILLWMQGILYKWLILVHGLWLHRNSQKRENP